MRNRVVALLPAVVLGAACHSGVEVPPPSSKTFADGTRLQALTLDGGDGAVVLTGWYDHVFRTPCEFARASDGVLRCLPRNHSSVFYADAACTQPIAVDYGGCRPEPRFAWDYIPFGDDAKGCSKGLGARVFTVGMPVAITGAYGWSGPAECSPLAVVPKAKTRAATEIAASEFVAAHVAIEPASASFGRRVRHADDGSWQVVGADDGAGACSPKVFDDGSIGCVPDDIAYDLRGYFADASCHESVAYMPGKAGCGPRPPRVVLRLDDPMADPRGPGTFGYFAVGPRSLGAYSRRDSGDPPVRGACLPLPGGQKDLYGVGAKLDADAFPHMTIAPTGSGRLVLKRHADANGTPLESEGEWFDTATGVACAPVRFADGTTRCVSRDDHEDYNPRDLVYGDAACSVPIVDTPLECTTPGLHVYGEYAAGCELTLKGLHEVGPERSDASFWMRDAAGRCTIEKPRVEGDLYREVGPPMDPARFPLMKSNG